jgi:CubicO group peptidase (beta-lactamase class C family)
VVSIFGRRRRVRLEGRLAPEFQAVANALRAQLRSSPGGGAVCVYHRGECVVDLWGGAMDQAGSPWRRDTMAPSFSTTKGVASTLIHILADRGLLDYDARVADYWPEFAQAGKAEITLRQVLCHQSGLYHIRQMVDDARRMLDWEYMIHAIERTPPIHPPGERTGYHGLTYGYLVGEIAQRVAGKPFPQLVQDEITRPLGLDGLYIGAPEEELHRAAKLIWPRRGLLAPGEHVGTHIPRWAHGRGPARLQRALRLLRLEVDVESILDALAPRGINSFDFNARETLRAAIPAANGLFTARSLARMYAMLAAGGELDGVRLLSPERVKLAAEIQTHARERVVIPFDMRWRLGYHGVFTTRGVPRNAFGHFGFGGSGAWADPSRQLGVALIVNSGLGTPFGDIRIVRISGAVLASVKRIA